MSSSLPYIEPKSARVHVQGEWQLIPHILWPSEYTTPSFEKWRIRGKESAARNLISLFLIESGLEKAKVAEFLEVSPARITSINRTMQIKLFGNNYKSYKEFIDKQVLKCSSSSSVERMLPFYHDKHMLPFYLEKQKNFSLYRMQAILASLSRMGRERKDHQLFHHAMECLAKNGINIELSIYDNML